MYDQQKKLESNPNRDTVTDTQGISLVEFWRALMNGKWIILSFTLAFSLASVAYALLLPNMYTSRAVLSAVDPSSLGSLSGISAELGGVAALAGINLGGQSPNKKNEALEILKSWSFIEEFIEENNIANQVFAVDRWDQTTDTLSYDQSIYDLETKTWTRETENGKPSAPSSWELYEKFLEYLNVSEDLSSGFIHIEIEYLSPSVAKEWVGKLVSMINRKLQIRDSSDAKANIAFLKMQIEQTSLASMHSVFYSLVEEQTKTLMLANASDEYVFKMVSEPRAPEEKSKPLRAVICVIGMFLGIVLGSFVVVIMFVRKRDKA
jgi:uncharacterized protein involved in exopolysaccharide biosynthesis